MKNKLLFFLFFINHFVAISQCEDVSVQLTTNFSPFEISSIIESDGLRNGDELPKVNSNELWLIEYKVDGQTYNNHYVAFTAPMDYEKYKNWLKDLKQKK
jgi:hypothetical protein